MTVLDEVITSVRTYKGLLRKKIISTVTKYLPTVKPENLKLLSSIGEDCGVFKCNSDDFYLLSADSIMEHLINTDPYWAGYCSVLVNVNDILAMGGRPVAMVLVLSVQDEDICTKIMYGVRDGVLKFNVPIVGGHTHPDCTYNSIDIAIFGIAKNVIFSSTASIGDDILCAVDLNGKFTRNIPYSWDTTSSCTSENIETRYRLMERLATEKLATSCKDVSNPGILGTLGMMLEISRKGAVVNVNRIPRPSDVDLLQWLNAYQGFGFIITCKKVNTHKIMDLFSKVGVTVDTIGTICKGNLLEISDGSSRKVLFDFGKDTIM
jgi:hypothetical protein